MIESQHVPGLHRVKKLDRFQAPLAKVERAMDGDQVQCLVQERGARQYRQARKVSRVGRMVKRYRQSA
jgi:endonuclease YncB( thermonuclease family)